MGQAAEKREDWSRVSYPVQKERERIKRRAAVHIRVVHPISTPQLIRDPLVRPSSPFKSTVTGTRVLIAAVVLHLVTLLLFVLLGRFMGERAFEEPSQAVVVEINDVPPPPPEPLVEEEPDDGPIADDFEKPPEEETPAPPPEVTNEPPVDPPPSAEPPSEEVPAEPPPRRIVGLSFESTVEGAGPAFATGTSRMGRTSRRAQDPKTAAQKPQGSTAGKNPGTGVRQQRAASHIPTQGGTIEKPKRVTPLKPGYPPTLKAQGIEGTVYVRVTIAASGAVTEAVVLKSSGQAAFDRAALTAAKREKFSPATRDGQPIPFTLNYSYRFRIEN